MKSPLAAGERKTGKLAEGKAMARQISEDHDNTIVEFEAWFDKWHEDRTKHRSFLLVRADEPLRENQCISVYIFPWMDVRDLSECFLDSRYRGKGYEHSRCLLNEELIEYTVSRLTTILTIIRDLQGIDFRQGLAFLIQLLILVLDHHQAQAGKESVLFGPPR